MDVLYREDSVEVIMGLNESLESSHAPEAQTEEPVNTLTGKQKRKSTSQVWSSFDFFH